jgi:hypothetical protein
MLLASVLTVPSRAASWNPLIVIVALMALPLTVPDNGPPGKQIELSDIDPVSAVPVWTSVADIVPKAPVGIEPQAPVQFPVNPV